MSRVEKSFGKFLLLSVVSLGLLGLIVQILEPMSERSASVFKKDSEKEPDAETLASVSLQRNPASVPPSDTTVVALDCAVAEQRIESQGPRIRISGNVCNVSADKIPQSMLIKNNTNHFVATIFRPNEKTFTTDLINLNSGENEITVKFTDGDQNLEKNLKIMRPLEKPLEPQ